MKNVLFDWYLRFYSELLVVVEAASVVFCSENVVVIIINKNIIMFTCTTTPTHDLTLTFPLTSTFTYLSKSIVICVAQCVNV